VSASRDELRTFWIEAIKSIAKLDKAQIPGFRETAADLWRTLLRRLFLNLCVNLADAGAFANEGDVMQPHQFTSTSKTESEHRHDCRDRHSVVRLVLVRWPVRLLNLMLRCRRNAIRIRIKERPIRCAIRTAISG
jgi:hypothetical protein